MSNDSPDWAANCRQESSILFWDTMQSDLKSYFERHAPIQMASLIALAVLLGARATTAQTTPGTPKPFPAHPVRVCWYSVVLGAGSQRSASPPVFAGVFDSNSLRKQPYVGVAWGVGSSSWVGPEPRVCWLAPSASARFAQPSVTDRCHPSPCSWQWGLDPAMQKIPSRILISA